MFFFRLKYFIIFILALFPFVGYRFNRELISEKEFFVVYHNFGDFGKFIFILSTGVIFDFEFVGEIII